MNETKENKYSSRYKSITYKRVNYCFHSLKICRQIFTYSYIPGCHIHVYLLFTYPFIIVFILIQMTLFAFYGHNKASTSDFRLTNVNQWYIIWLGISGTLKFLFLGWNVRFQRGNLMYFLKFERSKHPFTPTHGHFCNWWQLRQFKV